MGEPVPALSRDPGPPLKIRTPGFPQGASGGAEGIRTPDLLNAIEARSQLRHGPRQRLWYRGGRLLSTGPEADQKGQGHEDDPQEDG